MMLDMQPPALLQASTQFAFLSWDASLGRRMCPLATFGSRTPSSSALASRLVCVDPPRADCETLVNAADVRGSVALVVRGGCSFAQKARRIQDAGAVAMILANNTRDEPFAAFTMGETDEERAANALLGPITIPCVMMCLYDVRQLFKQFPPSVKTGVMKIEILDFDASQEARAILDECKRQRQLVIENQGVSGETSSAGNDSGNGGGGWWGIKRKTSSIMKLLDPQAAISSKPLSQRGDTNLSRAAIQQESGGSAAGDSRELSGTCTTTPDPALASRATLSSDAQPRKQPSTACTKAPLFAFVQWSTGAGAYQYHYAPLADFGLAGNNTIYQGKLVACDPILADESSLRNAGELSNAVALVKRGACTFPTKLERIQSCGAVAAIVGNDDTGDPDAAFVMSVDNIRVEHVAIPSVMVSLNVFNQLVADQVAFVRIICLSGEAAASFMANAGGSLVSLMEVPIPKPRDDAAADGNTDKKDALYRFHDACRAGDHGACQRILDERCADDSERRELVRTTDMNRLTALHHACAGGNDHVLALLLQLGALVDVSDIAMQTPLHIACMFGHVACVKSLVKASAAQLAMGSFLCSLTTKQNIGGSTPLHYAATAGSTDCLEVLLTVNARVDANGKYLFDGVSLPDNDGATPLHIACRHAHQDCAMYLIAANADLDAVDRSGRTTLHICCEMVNEPKFETASLHVIEKLVSAGACMREERGVSAEGFSALADGLTLDTVESKSLRRELEVMYLRHEARRAQLRSSDLERANVQLRTQLSELETQVKEAVAQNLAIQVASKRRAKEFEGQQTQIAQLHVQMKTIIQILHSHSDGAPSALPGALSTASLYLPSHNSLSILSQAKQQSVESSLSSTAAAVRDEGALALEAALARDLGKKFCREQKFAIAVMYFEKSLELFPLPGVHRLLEQFRKLHQEAEQRKAHENGHGMNNSRVVQTIGKTKLMQQLRATLSESNAPARVTESIEREVSKLVALEESSSEYETARKWLEWLVALPWGDPFSGLQNADFYLSNRDIFQQVSLLEQEEQKRHLQRAARRIQRAFREHYSVHMLTRSLASTRIQAVARGYLARRKHRTLLRTGVVAYCGDTQPHGAATNSGENEHNEDSTEVAVDYSTVLDRAARVKLRHAKKLEVIAGVHFVPESRDPSARVATTGSSSSPFHVLQLVRDASVGASSPITDVFAGAQKQPSPVYFVWSRWGDSTSGEPSQCTLSGPYEELGTARQRYERIVREQLQKNFVLAPPAAPGACKKSMVLSPRIPANAESLERSAAMCSSPALLQLSALSA